MAYYGTKDVALLVHNKNVSPDIDAVSFKASAITQEFKPLGSTYPIALDTGQRRAEIGCSGLYNNVAGTTIALADLSGTDRVVSLIHEGGLAGSRAWCLRSAKVSEVELGFDTEQMDSIAPGFAITGPVNQAYVVAPLVARTTGGNTDVDDADGGIASTGARAFIHVTALDLGGGTSLLVKVRSSSDAITYGDCSTAFTTITATGAESIALTGTVERYLSISWAWTGGSNQSFTAFVAVARD